MFFARDAPLTAVHLPSSSGDQDAVNLLLLLPRLVWKAEVVMGGVARFPQPETFDRATVLRSHAVDQYAFACRLRHLLHSLQVRVQGRTDQTVIVIEAFPWCVRL